MSGLRFELLEVLTAHNVASNCTTTYCHCGWSGNDQDYDRHLAGAIAKVMPELVFQTESVIAHGSEVTPEWGLWDEGREEWFVTGYQTEQEADQARTEMEKAMDEDDDTNLQVLEVKREERHPS